MSERRSSPAFAFVLLMLVASTAPLLMSVAADSGEDASSSNAYNAGGIIIGDLDEFDPSEGSEYLFIHEDEPVVSATQFMRQAWIDEGRPGVDDMVIEPSMGRSAGRACSPHVVGDTLTVPISGGSIAAYVAKTTNTVAFIVQSGRTLSSTVLNNLASTWDSTIYPTMTTYYGKDYQDGRGLAPPDIDNNCQVQIIIYDIDGAYNTGGYFAPSFSSSREAVFVDYADITLSWGRSILAHELEHLLHNALDPYENLWIDEGNADVAIYLCFGADSTLTGARECVDRCARAIRPMVESTHRRLRCRLHVHDVLGRTPRRRTSGSPTRAGLRHRRTGRGKLGPLSPSRAGGSPRPNDG
ncbi:MAG: hypothetical protein CM15mP78_11880 [Candidatus Poseidoniales archaeon]|nr:MAG: hypothetical protein CM15mP78_11880 [Candidatus Poseidoniales archaeon]